MGLIGVEVIHLLERGPWFKWAYITSSAGESWEERGENDGLRRDHQRLGHWALEGLRLCQVVGLGRLTSLFTARSSWGSPSMLATSANGRESRLFGVEAVIPDICIFDSYIKARIRQGCSPSCWACLHHKSKDKTTTKRKKKNTHIQAQPFTDCPRNLCKPMDPSYIFCYGPSFSVYQQIPKIM